MRKSIYLLAIFVAVAFIFTGCGKKAVDQNQAQNAAKGNVSEEEFQTTIEDMAKSGKPYQCTYSINDQNNIQEGTLYFAGENSFRGDVKVSTPQTGEKMTHFIKNGETQYIWSDGESTGMKITVSKEEEANVKGQAAQSNQQGVDTNAKVDMKCKTWSPDASLLTPPSNIQFQSLDDLMKAATGGAAEGAAAGRGVINSNNINMCAVCNQIPAGAARDSCKQSNCK